MTGPHGPDAFLRALADSVLARPDALPADLRAKVAALAKGAGPLERREAERDETTPEVVSHFGPALDRARAQGFGDLAGALDDARDLLPWVRGYPAELTGEAFQRSFAFAELVGSVGPFVAEDFAAGVTLIAPGTFYDWHKHPAVEIYLVLGPDSLWGLDGGAMSARAMGEVVLHPSWATHAMQTGGAPLLAPWFWFGDIAEPARMVDPDA